MKKYCHGQSGCIGGRKSRTSALSLKEKEGDIMEAKSNQRQGEDYVTLASVLWTNH